MAEPREGLERGDDILDVAEEVVGDIQFVEFVEGG